jgi:hypothetical protein
VFGKDATGFALVERIVGGFRKRDRKDLKRRSMTYCGEYVFLASIRDEHAACEGSSRGGNDVRISGSEEFTDKEVS